MAFLLWTGFVGVGFYLCTVLETTCTKSVLGNAYKYQRKKRNISTENCCLNALGMNLGDCIPSTFGHFALCIS